MMPSLPPDHVLPNRERCALLIIDVQERLSAAMPTEKLPDVLRNTRILIETAREFNLPVLISEQYPKGLGPTVAELRAVLGDGIQPVEKVCFSCCDSPDFQTVLQPLVGHDFILTGMETHVCVLQTALDLLERGHRVYIAADAVSSRTAFNQQIGLDLLRQAGAVIASTELLAFGLLGAAGSESFKRISKLVK